MRLGLFGLRRMSLGEEEGEGPSLSSPIEVLGESVKSTNRRVRTVRVE